MLCGHLPAGATRGHVEIGARVFTGTAAEQAHPRRSGSVGLYSCSCGSMGGSRHPAAAQAGGQRVAARAGAGAAAEGGRGTRRGVPCLHMRVPYPALVWCAPRSIHHLARVLQRDAAMAHQLVAHSKPIVVYFQTNR